jgi:hypothetical protein
MRCCCIAAFLCFTGAALADTNLLNAGKWSIDGADDPASNASPISVSVDREPAVSFSELKVFYDLSNLGPTQIFAIRGSGVLQPFLAPPSTTGAVFRINSYWDCDEGFVPPMQITELAMKSHGGGKTLKIRGRISNDDSLEATDFTLNFLPPRTNSASVELTYRLAATRELCVDMTQRGTQDVFRVVTMQTNYLSADEHQNDRVRFVRIVEKICGGLFGCHVRKKSFCFDLLNEEGYLVKSPRSLSSSLQLLHRDATPQNSPALLVKFRAPSKSSFKPQGFTTVASGADELNVSVWGNWADAKDRYKARQRIGRFRYTLSAEPPKDRSCDALQE